MWSHHLRKVHPREEELVDQLRNPEQVRSTERSLFAWVFDNIYKKFGHPLVNLFVTKENMQFPIYMPPIPEPMKWKKDAFQHPMDDLSIYVFPPFTLLWQILLRVILKTSPWLWWLLCGHKRNGSGSSGSLSITFILWNSWTKVTKPK